MCALPWEASASRRSVPPRRRIYCAVNRLRAEAFAEAGEKAKEAVDPISDFRGSAGYKKEMAAVFVRRALERALTDVRQKAKARPSAAAKPPSKKAARKVAKKRSRR